MLRQGSSKGVLSNHGLHLHNPFVETTHIGIAKPWTGVTFPFHLMSLLWLVGSLSKLYVSLQVYSKERGVAKKMNNWANVEWRSDLEVVWSGQCSDRSSQNVNSSIEVGESNAFCQISDIYAILLTSSIRLLYDFSHVYREHNMSADSLSKEALNMKDGLLSFS